MTLSTQGLVLLCLHSLSAVLDEAMPILKGDKTNLILTNPINPGVTRVLRDVSFPVAVFISLLSWGLMIPVDAGGLATFKNHFFHTFNTMSVILSMWLVPQAWCKYRAPLPLLYGLAYLGLQVRDVQAA